MNTVGRRHFVWIWGGVLFVMATLQYFVAQIVTSAA